jgi:hypothetical protein
MGRLATAIGSVGGNINAIEIVEHTRGGQAVDDVFLEARHDVMPDSIVSACNALEGVRVLWISRYAAGGNLFLDLEAVESMTAQPERAADRLVDMLPEVFRVDWGMRVQRQNGAVVIAHRTQSAPSQVPDGITWPTKLGQGRRLELGAPYDELLVAGCPLDDDDLVVIARRGGPQILDSEIARLAHLVALAGSIGR